MAADLSIVISATALCISLAGFGLSAYVAITNAHFLKTQKRSDLLTRIKEAKIQYQELNQRYRDLASRMKYIKPDILDTLIQYREYEKFTEGHYEFVQGANLSAAKIEELRHHIDGMILAIAADNRRIDDFEKKYKAG